jgi:hypothetical protein
MTCPASSTCSSSTAVSTTGARWDAAPKSQTSSRLRNCRGSVHRRDEAEKHLTLFHIIQKGQILFHKSYLTNKFSSFLEVSYSYHVCFLHVFCLSVSSLSLMHRCVVISHLYGLVNAFTSTCNFLFLHFTLSYFPGILSRRLFFSSDSSLLVRHSVLSVLRSMLHIRRSVEKASFNSDEQIAADQS